MSTSSSAQENSPDAAAARTAGLAGLGRALLWVTATAALASSTLLWQQLAHTQEQLARQSAASSARANEAQAQAQQAQGMAQTAKAQLAVAESNVDDLLAWRRQADEMLQTAVRARDDSLIIDLAAMLQAAQIQARLTGDPAPLQETLHLVRQRIHQAANPRLAAAARAARQDLQRVQSADAPDIGSLLAQLDALWEQVDTLPAANDAAPMPAPAPAAQQAAEQAVQSSLEPPAPWWQRAWHQLRASAGQLVRVSRMQRPDASMMSPDQVFFVRQHVKMRLQGARLALLAGRRDAAQADLQHAAHMLDTLFAAQAPAARDMLARLERMRQSLQSAPLPDARATLAALSDAASAQAAALSHENAGADTNASTGAEANTGTDAGTNAPTGAF